MLKGLKALFLFAAMVAIPIVADNALHRRPDLPLQIHVGPWSGIGLVLFVAAALIAGMIHLVYSYYRLDQIADWLRLAERDFNFSIYSGYDHGGRKGKVAERAEWNRMALTPGFQVFNAGYRTVAHEAFELNEKDLASKGAAMGKACTTAFLLRHLYEGDVEVAQAKVFADEKNGGSPYIAPGIRELIGYDKFDKDNGFPDGAGVGWFELKTTVLLWRFPRHIRIERAPNDTIRGWAVIREMTQQAPK